MGNKLNKYLGHDIIELEWMVGRLCTNIESKASHYWIFDFGEECKLVSEGSWRMISASQITLTQNDHKQQWGQSKPLDAVSIASELIKDSPVIYAGYTKLGDLIIDFNGSHTLQIMINSCMYESWNLYGPNDCLFVGMGGGDVAEFPPSSPIS